MPTKARPRALAVPLGVAALALAATATGCTSLAGAPTPTPTPTAVVDYQQQANDNWWNLWMVDYPDAVRPDVEVVREVTQAEWAYALADCMAASGYPDTDAGPEGGIGITHAPEGQREAQLVALYVCHAQYPMAEKYLRPFTPEQLGELYDYWTGDLTDCLVSSGFVPTEEPPSRETFIQEADSVSWTPLNGLADAVDESEFGRIAAACPRYPDYIY